MRGFFVLTRTIVQPILIAAKKKKSTYRKLLNQYYSEATVMQLEK